MLMHAGTALSAMLKLNLRYSTVERMNIMQININELMDYYAQASTSFYDAFSDAVPSGSRSKGWSTYPGTGGIIIPVEGSACFTLNGSSYVMTPGMVVHAGPGMSLDKEVIGNQTWRYVLVHYKIPESELNSFPYYNEHFNISVGMNPRLFEITKQILVSYADSGSAAILRSRTLFHHLIEEIVVSANRQKRDNNGELIGDAVHFIQEQYQQPILISELAKQYGLSNKYFIELFQRYTGTTPVRYLTERRIERAKELIKKSSCPIKEIAECVGYADNQYFSRIFRKQTGMSPSEFREYISSSLPAVKNNQACELSQQTK